MVARVGCRRTNATEYDLMMRVTTGKVVQGKVVVDGESLAEGSRVTILVADDQSRFDLAPEDVALLRESIAQADRGEVVDGERLLEEIVRDR